MWILAWLGVGFLGRGDRAFCSESSFQLHVPQGEKYRKARLDAGTMGKISTESRIFPRSIAATVLGHSSKPCRAGLVKILRCVNPTNFRLASILFVLWNLLDTNQLVSRCARTVASSSSCFLVSPNRYFLFSGWPGMEYKAVLY